MGDQYEMCRSDLGNGRPGPVFVFASNTGGCFAKGTLVHTKDGLKPIEEIKVGDYVLSSPEDGAGSQDYKRVLRTFRHENKTISRIITPGSESNRYVWVAATGNHPFWVEDKGWTRADKVKKNDIFRKVDGRLTAVFKQRPIYRTEQEGVGFESHFDDARTSYGTLFDYANNRSVPKGDNDDYISQEIYVSDDPYLGVTVYNIEVEDYHTYYVGKTGIWVHNTNCLDDGIQLFSRLKGTKNEVSKGVVPSGDTPLFDDTKALDAALAAKRKKGG